tara:strand:+ start:468 stop:1562 length:1095 start_codon:yes stop_codon:yes gene_type:complete
VFDSSRQNSNIGASTSGKDTEDDAKIGVGSSLFKRIQLASDGYVRLALPGNESREVDKRPISDLLYGFLFAFGTLAILGTIDALIEVNFQKPFFIGAWGTISVLAFGTNDAPALRMWNVVVATVFASFVAICFVKFFGTTVITRALAVAISIAFMMWTGAIHPPGGAACVIAMDMIKWQELGFLYALYPTVLGSAFICASGAVCSKVKKRWPFTIEDVKSAMMNMKRPNGKEMVQTLKSCGSGGIFAYGIMNTLWYSFGIVTAVYAITASGATSLALIKPKLLPALAAVWAGSQATKLFRISSSIALAPLCDKILNRVNRRLNETNSFSKSQTLFWTCIATVLLGCAFIAACTFAFLAKAKLFV